MQSRVCTILNTLLSKLTHYGESYWILQSLSFIALQVVDSTSAPVEVLSAAGGDSADSANFQFAINFGLVLGFSLTGDKIAENPDGALILVKMEVSNTLAGWSCYHQYRFVTIFIESPCRDY